MDLDFTTNGDIADRFTHTTTCNKATAQMLRLRNAEYTLDQGAKYLRRLIRAAQACGADMDSRDKAERLIGKIGTLEPATVKDLRDTFKHKEGFQFPLEYEASEAYEAKQYKETQRGELGNFTNKQIVGRLPDPTVTHKVSQVPVDSALVEVTKESKSAPSTDEQWVQQMRVFYYTLTKCIYGSPSHPIFAGWSLTVAKQYYEDFLFGDQIMKRKEKPTTKTLMIAERKAWAEIQLDIYKNNTSLKDAMEKIMNRTLFWTNEMEAGAKAAANKVKKGKYVSDYKAKKTIFKPWRGSKGKGSKGGGKGSKGKSKGSKGGKGNWGGKGKKGGKGGKGKGKATSQYCWNFHHGNGCPGGCNRSHQCPVCGQTHRQDDHH